MLIDSHCHLYFHHYDQDRKKILDKARSAGVRAFINVGIDEATSQAAIALAESEEDIYATVGLHPHSAHDAESFSVDRLESLANSSARVVAIGEIGLDYVKSKASPQKQREVFLSMIRMAHRVKLPIVIHSRNSLSDTLKVLKEVVPEFPDLKAVFHCFSYDGSGLLKVLDMGFHVSFTCNVTFPNAHEVKEAARLVPMDRFMIETDSPYLAPQAFRGSRNEPSYLMHLVETLAHLKSVVPSQIEESSSKNSVSFFKLPSIDSFS